MLIKALCDYYELLAENGKILPDGYSKVNIHYLVCLTADGKIDVIIDWQKEEKIKTAKGEIKKRQVPSMEIMPQRTEKSALESNIVEHRPLYLFGLNLSDEKLTPDDRTGKARKSHEIFVETNLKFLEGLDSPVVNAYRNFLKTWKPEEETENRDLLQLGKNYGKSGFAFCLTGHSNQLLHEDVCLKEKWAQIYRSKAEEGYVAQCAISGERAEIARIHNKIKGVYGGLATGSVLVGFKNPSAESYGNKQSYNSNVSQEVMTKYTEVLNFLLESNKHKILLDDITIVFWAMDASEMCEDTLMAMLCGQSDKMDAEKTENMLRKILEDAQKGKITEERLKFADMTGENVDFYMLGLKPNSSRLSMKFIYRKKYADLLWNIAKFQKDLQVSEEIRPVSIGRIKEELRSPKSTSEKINPALLSKLFESVIYGKPYPNALLETIIRRVKADGDSGVNRIRVGIIKACVNRNSKKEELGVALDKENSRRAYLCGRLFAVLERLQEDAAGRTKLNRTIKDTYFTAAMTRPSHVFPKLFSLAEHHLNKVKIPSIYEKLFSEIMEKMDGKFPEILPLQEQGEFIVGYYQQYPLVYKKDVEIINNGTEENENGN